MYIMIVYDVIRTRPWSHNINSWAVDNHGMSINPLAPWHLKGNQLDAGHVKVSRWPYPSIIMAMAGKFLIQLFHLPGEMDVRHDPPKNIWWSTWVCRSNIRGRPDNPVDDHNFPNEKSHLLAGISNFQTQPNTNYIWLVYSFILKTKQSHQISQFQENMHWQFYRNPI